MERPNTFQRNLNSLLWNGMADITTVYDSDEFQAVMSAVTNELKLVFLSCISLITY